MTETKPAKPVAEQSTATPASVYDHSTPAAKAADDVEAQKPVPVAVVAAAATSGYDDEAGKSIGIAMFVCIVVGFVLGWLGPSGAWIAFGCLIAAIVLSSVITCGCCCGANLNLNPKIKRWSTATLLCLIIQWVLAVIAISIASVGVAMNEMIAANVAFGLLVITQILYILAGVFAGIFTWGRKSCGNA